MSTAHTQASIEDLRSRISIDAVRDAREVIAPHLPRTALMRHPLLVEALGVEVWLKHENHLPTGAFKIRGGLNYMHHLPAAERARGVVTATRGNHGQSIAFAAHLHGVRCVIVVPHGNNPDKNAAMIAYGAELVEYGKDFDEAREKVEMLERDEGLTYVHSGNEPELINGVGTYSLEILEELPDVDAVIVPVGGGTAICGAATVFRALKPEVRIIGVQAENAPANYLSWKEKKTVCTDSADTFADGLATRVPFELPEAIMRDQVDEMLLVSEEEIREALRLILRTTHNLVEGAAATPIAALKKIAGDLAGKKVAAVASGGNIDLKTLRWVLDG